MNIVVVMKMTPDTEEKIVLQDGHLQEDGIKFIINPYDEYAVEEGIRLVERFGGELTVVTIGSDRAESVLRTALAMGADKALLIDGGAIAADEYTLSKMLAAYIRGTPFDLVLAGNASIDNGAGQVGIRLAEELNIAHVSSVTKIEIDGARATVVCDVEGNSETIEAGLPFLATAQQGLNEPRYPSLPGIMKAKKKPLTRVSLDELGVQVQALNPKTVVVDQYLAPAKAAGRVLAGDLKDQAAELAELLIKEAKVV